MSTPTPIHLLDPTISPPPSQTTHGVVTLIWPYSSSTHQFAFLLSDPDFRLRSRRGQVRVRFTGASAKAVAEKHVGIGDEVTLGLEGAVWGEDMEAGRTPGRSVEGELVLGRRVGLDVKRAGAEGGVERVDVDAPASPPASKAQEQADQINGHLEAFTPAPRPANGLLRRSIAGGSFATDGGWTYSSPAFAKRVRLSGESSFLDAAFDPFVDGELASPTKETRTSFGTGLRWRYQSRTPSPVKQRVGDVEGLEASPSRAWKEREEVEYRMDVDKENEVEVISDENSEEDIVEVDSPTRAAPVTPSAKLAPAASSPVTSFSPAPASCPLQPRQETPPAMPPPSLSRLSMRVDDHSESISQREKPQQRAEGPSTPKIGPIASPTLPLPSPFPADAAGSLARPPAYSANSLFGALGSAASVIESRRLSGRTSQSQLRPSQSASLPPHVNAVLPQSTVSTLTNEAAKSSETPTIPAAETIDFTDDWDHDIEVPDDVAPVQEAALEQSFSTTIANEEMYDDYERGIKDQHARDDKIMRRQDDVATEPALNINGRSPIKLDEDSDNGVVVTGVEAVEPSDTQLDIQDRTITEDENTALEGTAGSHQSAPPDAFSLDGASSAFAPPTPSPKERKSSSPSKSLLSTSIAQTSTTTPKAGPSAFSLDGAAFSRPTPVAEKERVKKKTYRSLFGLRSPQKDGSPPVAPAPVQERHEERFIPGWFFEVEGQRQQDQQNAKPLREGHNVLGGRQGTNEPEAGHEDVIMADAVFPPDGEFSRTFGSEMDLQHERETTATSTAVRSSGVQVIELDASSDIEEEDQDDNATKSVAPVPSSSSPVIQDSLEHSQDETFPVSEDEKPGLRRGAQPAVQRLQEGAQAETSLLSSPLSEPRMTNLAQEAADKSGIVAQRRSGLSQQTEQESPLPQDVEMASSPTPKASELPVLEHIAPPRSTAATTVVEPDPSSESEQFPSSPVNLGRLSRASQALDELTEGTLPQTREEPPRRRPRKTSQPALPLSPSNSQSLQDMQSQRSIDELKPSKFPPTPQLTQRESSLRSQERLSQKTPAPKLLRNESSLGAEAKAAESPITPQTKTPSRRSARLRTSNVPESLSEWFSPRNSGVTSSASKPQMQSQEHSSANEETDAADAAITNGHASSSRPSLTQLDTTGLATAHSYFTPLSRVPDLVNPASQHGPNTLDVLAVVTDGTKQPVRTKAGPKDCYTILCIADLSIAAGESLRVEVFRPYKDTLPVAYVGDVVLLRGFTVKSRKRTPYLLSTRESAWCVWRRPDGDEEKKPPWARKGKARGMEEEIRGPPVEFGEEERAQAERLREWWVSSRASVQSAKADGHAHGSVGDGLPAKL